MFAVYNLNYRRFLRKGRHGKNYSSATKITKSTFSVSHILDQLRLW